MKELKDGEEERNDTISLSPLKKNRTIQKGIYSGLIGSTILVVSIVFLSKLDDLII